MKKHIGKIFFSLLVGGLATFSACSDWTEMESINQDSLLSNETSSEYYAGLREWKAKKDHQITFGWYGNWTGVGANLEHSMRSLPDSVDFISIWGSWRNLTDAQKKDLKYVQEVKGTKALLCFIVANIGDQVTPEEVRDNWQENAFGSEQEAVNNYWGWTSDDESVVASAIDRYAKALCDTIHKYNYDGFDIDYEPHFGHSGNLSSYGDRMLIFCQSMRNHLGSGKYLVVDGEPQSMPKESGPLMDYFIVQAYRSYGDADLNGRLQSTISNYDGVLTAQEVARKYIVTENFESLAVSGGTGYYQDIKGKTFNSLEGMARWVPVIDGDSILKGGIGTYHMEYEYKLSLGDATYEAYPWLSKSDLSYPWLRSGMRAMRALEAIPTIKR